MSEKEQKHYTALELVELIDYHLRNGTCHFYDFNHRLLTTLDQVVNAILNNELMVGRPVTELAEAA